MNSTLRRDLPAYTMEVSDLGFVLKVVEGREDEFSEIARALINSVDGGFSVFPRSIPGGYDFVEIVLHDDL